MNRMIVYIMMCLFVTIMSWEYQLDVSASFIHSSPGTDVQMNVEQGIPEEAVRLRILANSDSAQDQWLKREVRDELVHLISSWIQAKEIETIDQARMMVQTSLSELNKRVSSVITSRGYHYRSQIEYGTIPFPTKLYGNTIYPAGEYEGLLITIGAGQGANWWCVLFPPLCFVDFGTGSTADGEVNAVSTVLTEEDLTSQPIEKEEEKVEVKFFVIEIIDKILSWF